MNKNINICIFASGEGTNAENFINFFIGDKNIKISSIISNNPNAPVIQKAKNNNIITDIIKKDFFSENIENADLIVLAGFTWLVPKSLIERFPNRIINIHPSLLPKFGGKGMYGRKVHEEVKKNNQKFTGITIHLINDEYDKGDIIFQKEIKIDRSESVADIESKVRKLEITYYPKVVRDYALSLTQFLACTK